MISFRFPTVAAAVLSLELLAPGVAAGQSIRVIGEERLPLEIPADAHHAAWSPDAGVPRLAFTTGRYADIWIADLDAGTVTRISDSPGIGFGFSWSPDGTAIVSRASQYAGLRRLSAPVVVDVEASTQQLLDDWRPTVQSIPIWSPDGASAAVRRNGRTFLLPVSGPPRTGKRAVPTATADGDALILLTSGSADLPPTIPFPGKTVLNASLSPDGAYVAFEIMGGNLYVMRNDGSDLVDLGTGHRPAWSPDSRWIAFMQSKDDGYRFVASDLIAATRDGAVRIDLTESADRLEMNPSWSPDGNRIAFDDGETLFLLAIEVAE